MPPKLTQYWQLTNGLSRLINALPYALYTPYQEEPIKDRIGVVTRKGQVTLPAEVRNSLGLRQGDKVIFRLQDDQVMVKRTESVVSATAGVFKSDRPALTAEELRVVAEEAIAEEVAERSS